MNRAVLSKNQSEQVRKGSHLLFLGVLPWLIPFSGTPWGKEHLARSGSPL